MWELIRRTLKSLLPTDTQYIGIDIESSEFVQSINLEKEQLPFAPGQFDCVLALDVLEHVDNIYEVFDSLCRVSAKYVIISLPNPWAAMIAAIQNGSYQEGVHMKFYGLPVNPPVDRHKWFFSYSEANRFVAARAKVNNMKVLDTYTESVVQPQAITDLLKVWGGLGKGIYG
jgi:ubiquinone/menaquinone biosynthesis C-methylase UbiE